MAKDNAVSQADPNLVRQRVQQAREHIAKTDYAKARALLKGLEHPKAHALLEQIDAASPAPQRTGLPCRAILFLIGFVVLLAGIGLALLFSRPQAPTPEPLPTLIPTSDCNEALVQAWWTEHLPLFDRFTQDASSASRMMPGERLAQQIDALNTLAAQVTAASLPLCASSTDRTRLGELQALMRSALNTLSNWQMQLIDGTTMSNQMAVWEQTFRGR